MPLKWRKGQRSPLPLSALWSNQRGQTTWRHPAWAAARTSTTGRAFSNLLSDVAPPTLCSLTIRLNDLTVRQCMYAIRNSRERGKAATATPTPWTLQSRELLPKSSILSQSWSNLIKRVEKTWAKVLTLVMVTAPGTGSALWCCWQLQKAWRMENGHLSSILCNEQ